MYSAVVLAFSIRVRSSGETAAEKGSMTKHQLFHDASSPAKLKGFPSTRMSTIEADEVVVTGGAGATSRCFQVSQSCRFAAVPVPTAPVVLAT